MPEGAQDVMASSELDGTISTHPFPATTEPMVGHPGTAPNPNDAQVPAGVHPRDNSVPYTDPALHHAGTPIAKDVDLGPQGKRRGKPWAVENEEALGVFQRAAHDWDATTWNLSTESGTGSPSIQLAGRQKGRVSVIIAVPSTATNGVVIAATQGEADLNLGIALNPGDSWEIPTEGAIWAGLISGKTTGQVAVVQLYNPPGGGLGLSSS